MQLRAAVQTPYFPIENVQDDDAWAERNRHWETASPKAKGRRGVHERTGRPLVLSGHGVSLSIDKGTLLVRNGFTHHPQERETFRFFKGSLDLPPRIIMLDGSGSLSFDVLSWLSEQNVPLIRIDYQGEVVAVISGAMSAYDPHRVAWQVETRADPERRLAFCCDLIAEKITNSVTTLKTVIPPSGARDVAIERAGKAIGRLQARAVETVTDVLMVEAGAAAAYFSAWRGLSLRWKSKAKHPIPEAWANAGSRRTVRDSRFSTNRNATHPVNAMLNYAYGLLHSQVQIEAVSQGYDPRRGLMHESRLDAHALILDLMEPHRPAVDAAVLKFVTTNTFTGADFVIRSDGVCRLSPQLARHVCGLFSGADFSALTTALPQADQQAPAIRSDATEARLGRELRAQPAL